MYYIYVWKTSTRQWKPSTSKFINQNGYRSLNVAHRDMDKASARYNHSYHYRVVESGTYIGNMAAPE